EVILFVFCLICLVAEGYSLCFFFFFQAEDGIRDGHVTGVQTCALPISFTIEAWKPVAFWRRRRAPAGRSLTTSGMSGATRSGSRSEERRVGKECRSRWAADH